MRFSLSGKPVYWQGSRGNTSRSLCSSVGLAGRVFHYTASTPSVFEFVRFLMRIGSAAALCQGACSRCDLVIHDAFRNSSACWMNHIWRPVHLNPRGRPETNTINAAATENRLFCYLVCARLAVSSERTAQACVDSSGSELPNQARYASWQNVNHKKTSKMFDYFILLAAFRWVVSPLCLCDSTWISVKLWPTLIKGFIGWTQNRCKQQNLLQNVQSLDIFGTCSCFDFLCSCSQQRHSRCAQFGNPALNVNRSVHC